MVTILLLWYGLGTFQNFGSSISPKKIYIILWTMFRHTVYSVFVKKIFCNFYRFLKKWCFEPKKVDAKSSNGHKFPLTEPNCKYLGILERSCYVEFENNVTKKILGQKFYRVTSCSLFFLQCSSPKISMSVIFVFFLILQENALTC
jgi:hypothetical protein